MSDNRPLMRIAAAAEDIAAKTTSNDAAAGDTGGSTNNGFLRWIRDFLFSSFGAKSDPMAGSDTGANSLIALTKRVNDYLRQVIGVMTNSITSDTLSSLNQEVVVTVGNRGAVGFQITGTNAGGVITFKYSQDNGATYNPINAIPVSAGGDNNPTSTASAAGNFVIIGGGITHVKAQLTSAGAGSFTVTAVTTPAYRNIGVPAIGSALDTAATSDTGSATLIQLFKRLLSKTPDPTIAVTTGTFNQIGDEVVLAVPAGHSSATMVMYGTYTSVTGSFYFRLDGQWFVFSGHNDSAQSSSINTAAATAGAAMQFSIPAGATAIKCACTAFGSKTSLTVVIATSTRTPHTQVGMVQLSSGTNRVGQAARPAVWTRESITPVNAGQYINGAAKTTFNTSSGIAINTAASYGASFAALAGADVSGTLIIEASPDTGTTWYPVASAALAQIGGSGNFGAYLEVPISEATMRARILNGGTNQARTFLTTRMLG